jgi:hypothetical protein
MLVSILAAACVYVCRDPVTRLWRGRHDIRAPSLPRRGGGEARGNLRRRGSFIMPQYRTGRAAGGGLASCPPLSSKSPLPGRLTRTASGVHVATRRRSTRSLTRDLADLPSPTAGAEPVRRSRSSSTARLNKGTVSLSSKAKQQPSCPPPQPPPLSSSGRIGRGRSSHSMGYDDEEAAGGRVLL